MLFGRAYSGDTPCYGCADRTAECHATCERYREFSEKCEEARQERHRQESARHAQMDMIMERVDRSYRRKRRNRGGNK